MNADQQYQRFFLIPGLDIMNTNQDTSVSSCTWLRYYEYRSG